MKKIIVIFIAASISFTIACTKYNSQAQSASMFVQEATIAKNVPTNEFKELIDKKKNAILLDVRTPKEVAAGHLANSRNIDYYSDNFKSELEKLDKTKPILVYCHSGHRSGLTMSTLKEMGFTEVYNLETGIIGWKAAGLPIEK